MLALTPQDVLAVGEAELDPMSEGVEVLEVDDDDYFGRPGPSRLHQAPPGRDAGDASSRPQQARGQHLDTAAEGGVIDLEADEDRPSSIRTSR